MIWRDTVDSAARKASPTARRSRFTEIFSVFEARGQYQLSVQILQLHGVGVLQAKFEALKRKLEAEGLFAAERKRALPQISQANRDRDFTKKMVGRSGIC